MFSRILLVAVFLAALSFVVNIVLFFFLPPDFAIVASEMEINVGECLTQMDKTIILSLYNQSNEPIHILGLEEC